MLESGPATLRLAPARVPLHATIRKNLQCIAREKSRLLSLLFAGNVSSKPAPARDPLHATLRKTVQCIAREKSRLSTLLSARNVFPGGTSLAARSEEKLQDVTYRII